MTLVSVITPTWQRHDLLMNRCIPSVRAQIRVDVEHIVVSDGPDPTLAAKLAGVTFDHLDEHLNGAVDYGSRARNRGLEVATGKFIAYLDDDNAYRPDHLALLVRALRRDPLADFAYSQMQRHPNGDLIGAPAPQYGGIDTSLIVHRAGVPERYGMWPLPAEIQGDIHAPDWAVVEQWLANGARWTHVPQVTVDYYFPGPLT